jgi:hypothetical protein
MKTVETVEVHYSLAWHPAEAGVLMRGATGLGGGWFISATVIAGEAE